MLFCRDCLQKLLFFDIFARQYINHDEMARFRYALLIGTLFVTATSLWAVNHIPIYGSSSDSVKVRIHRWSELPEGRITHSTYPVKIIIRGKSLRIVSKYEQVLPIYKNSGDLYLAMQLTQGVNWINGLPRGCYRINNQTISIQ